METQPFHSAPGSDPADGIPVPAIEAVLQTGATETHYRRAGRGSAVLLLFPGGAADPAGARLFDRLAGRFRVIAPRPPAGVEAGEPSAASVSQWLRDVIDGLGLARPRIVADESFGVAALGLSLADPERVGGLVTLSRDPSDPAGALGSVLKRSDRLLFLRMDAIDEIMRFLDADSHAEVPL